MRFNSGGSGSFVSAGGLVLTNHHVGADALHKLSSAEHDYVRDGFLARTAADEVQCLDLELNVLVEIRDVTARVTAALKPEMSLAESEKARRAVINTIEQESTTRTKLRSDVVTLYNGGLYHFYMYKKYTDVRLVFAPEQQIAFFGGDPDNFEYPRYDLDICFFRAYENGKPAKIDHYLEVERGRAEDGELIFVAGHPGHTDRLKTVEHLEFLRDVEFPGIAGTAVSPRSAAENLQRAIARKRPPGGGRVFQRAEFCARRWGRIGRAARPADHGHETGGRAGIADPVSRASSGSGRSLPRPNRPMPR